MKLIKDFLYEFEKPGSIRDAIGHKEKLYMFIEYVEDYQYIKFKWASFFVAKNIYIKTLKENKNANGSLILAELSTDTKEDGNVYYFDDAEATGSAKLLYVAEYGKEDPDNIKIDQYHEFYI